MAPPDLPRLDAIAIDGWVLAFTQVSATDPATFAGIGAPTAAVALLGCVVPAVRAVRIDPIEVLRAD